MPETNPPLFPVQVGIHYDPMIAKVIAHGANRNEAIDMLSAALRDFQVAGFPTNASYLSKLLKHQAFRDAQLNTHFIENHKVDTIFLCGYVSCLPYYTLLLAEHFSETAVPSLWGSLFLSTYIMHGRAVARTSSSCLLAY